MVECWPRLLGVVFFGPNFLLFCLLCTVLPFGLSLLSSLFPFLGHTCLLLPTEHICLIKMLPVVHGTEELMECFQAELCRVMRGYLGFRGEAGKRPLPWQISI